MSVKTYSLKADGSKALSANFKVREFRCKDGSDKILVETALVNLLQELREHFGKAVTISSAYRTGSHNTAVGGSPRSRHLLGTAADISIYGVTPLEVAQYAEALMPSSGGIGLYKTFTHVDMRTSRTRWDSTSGKERAVAGFAVDYAAKAQARFGFDDNTMAYLGRHPYPDALMKKLATAD